LLVELFYFSVLLLYFLATVTVNKDEYHFQGRAAMLLVAQAPAIAAVFSALKVVKGLAGACHYSDVMTDRLLIQSIS